MLTTSCQTKPQKGDVISVDRGLYYHYGIYSGDSTVINYTAENSDFWGKVSIMETDLDSFLHGGSYHICHFSEKPDYAELRPIVTNRAKSKEAFIPIELLFAAITEINHLNYRIYSPDETVHRARSRIGEKDYNLLFNNCEHFALWCKTGISESFQVSNTIRILLEIGLRLAKANSNRKQDIHPDSFSSYA